MIKLTPVYINRLNKEIQETQRKLVKVNKEHQDDIQYLKMEIAQNEELGNGKDANVCAIEYCKKSKDRITELENHIIYLKNILVKGEL